MPADAVNSADNTNRASLEFINRPIPVEPSNVSRTLSGREQLLEHANSDLLRLIWSSKRSSNAPANASQSTANVNVSKSAHSIAAVLNDQDDVRPARNTFRRQLSDNDQSLYTLPEPHVKQGIKRPRNRVPPVLQGLHQPPPDAGILPSITTQKKRNTTTDKSAFDGKQLPDTEADSQSTNKHQPPEPQPQHNTKSEASKRKMWTDQETVMLMQGAAKYGVGNWKAILLCPDYKFNSRSANDLKDRFRHCSMAAEKARISTSRRSSPLKVKQTKGKPAESDLHPRSNMAETVDTTNLPRAKRRQRTAYTSDEDDAIIAGFRRYGGSWTSIQLDPRLKARTPNDIRDRFRTRFATEYSGPDSGRKQPKAASKPYRSAPSHPSAALDNDNKSNDKAKRSKDQDKPNTTSPSEPSGTTQGANKPALLQDAWLFDIDLPEENETAFDTDPIVLDRSIMEWANRNLPSLPSVLAPLDAEFQSSVDPLATLMLPKPG